MLEHLGFTINSKARPNLGILTPPPLGNLGLTKVLLIRLVKFSTNSTLDVGRIKLKESFFSLTLYLLSFLGNFT